MTDSPTRKRLENLCTANGLRYRNILVWRTGSMITNAAVLGFWGPLRYLLVTDALLDEMTSDELTAVFAHEVGHVVGRHGAKMLTRQYGIAILAQIALGEDPGMVSQLVAQIAATGAMMKYSRDAEREADRFGVDEMYRAGIDPVGIETFFGKLKAMHEREPSSIENFFSTHPPTEERIRNTRDYIASLPPKAGQTGDSERFHRIQDRVRSRSTR